jgi:outer membrane immunogenic protein
MTFLKTALFGASMIVSAGALTAANAADVYQKNDGWTGESYAYAPITWSGFYAGIHGGGAWADIEVTHVDFYNSDGSFSFDDNGFFGGGQIGYNWQHGSIVYGVEAELGSMGFDIKKQDPNFFDAPPNPELDSIARFETGFYGALTGRLGLAADNWLFYAKGGAAFVNAKASYTDDNAGGDLLVDGTSKSETLGGWVVGGGVEYALSGNWSVKAEYLHFDFADVTVNATGDSGDHFDFKFDSQVDTVKAGINYKFGPESEPLK